jgi:putative SOS response-associated peptidase YedK
MCGRFVQRYTWDDLQDLYDLPDGPARNLQAHYNIAPTDSVQVLRQASNGARELISMRWGLIPWWWKKPLKQLPASFNARAETVADKPMFRDAFQRQRCVIPASGYYEWLKRPDGKQPYFISATDLTVNVPAMAAKLGCALEPGPAGAGALSSCKGRIVRPPAVS